MRVDLSGLRVGNFVVLNLHHSDEYRHKFYQCKCDCGTVFVKRDDMIKNAKHKACNNCKRKRNDMVKHNKSNTKLYRIYYGMKQRCNNPSAREYHNYGGRGIKVCDEWENDFSSFYNWSIGNGYTIGLQLDRINNDENYEPNNCRWVTPIINSNNKRTCVYFEYNGKKLSINQWSRELGINKNTLWRYLRVKKYDIEYIIKVYCRGGGFNGTHFM